MVSITIEVAASIATSGHCPAPQAIPITAVSHRCAAVVRFLTLPLLNTISPAPTMPMKAPVMETRLGGRWYELAEDGSQATVGKIIVWEPPQRFVMTWEINSQWKPDSTVGSEVEVRFIADGANATRVEVEHRKFEQMGAEGGASMRKDVDGGWPGLLERFKTEAEAA